MFICFAMNSEPNIITTIIAIIFTMVIIVVIFLVLMMNLGDGQPISQA